MQRTGTVNIMPKFQLPLVLLICWPFATTSAADRTIDDAVVHLREALDSDDMVAFDRILNEGLLDPAAFGAPAAHEVLCASTAPDRTPFLFRLLEFGIDPNVRNPEGSRLDELPLACARLYYNVEAFDALLEAGADTSLGVCRECALQDTLFTIMINMPPFSSRILERRRLTPFEVGNLTFQVENTSLANSHEGQPTYKWYQDVLREYGVDNLEPFSARD